MEACFSPFRCFEKGIILTFFIIFKSLRYSTLGWVILNISLQICLYGEDANMAIRLDDRRCEVCCYRSVLYHAGLLLQLQKTTTTGFVSYLPSKVAR